MSENVAKDPVPAQVVEGHGAHSVTAGGFGVLALGSIGVVFGDIGTSPLYALQTALGQFKSRSPGGGEVIGIVSLIIWALLIVVTAKYVALPDAGRQQGRGRHPVA